LTKHNASEILGIIFPFLPRHAERLLDGGKDVFAKYLARANLAGLKVGNRILFYVSGGSRQIVGEARIGQIEFLTPDQLLEKYEDRLFITREELRQYTTKHIIQTVVCGNPEEHEEICRAGCLSDAHHHGRDKSHKRCLQKHHSKQCPRPTADRTSRELAQHAG